MADFVENVKNILIEKEGNNPLFTTDTLTKVLTASAFACIIMDILNNQEDLQKFKSELETMVNPNNHVETMITRAFMSHENFPRLMRYLSQYNTNDDRYRKIAEDYLQNGNETFQLFTGMILCCMDDYKVFMDKVKVV